MAPPSDHRGALGDRGHHDQPAHGALSAGDQCPVRGIASPRRTISN